MSKNNSQYLSIEQIRLNRALERLQNNAYSYSSSDYVSKNPDGSLSFSIEGNVIAILYENLTRKVKPPGGVGLYCIHPQFGISFDYHALRLVANSLGLREADLSSKFSIEHQIAAAYFGLNANEVGLLFAEGLPRWWVEGLLFAFSKSEVSIQSHYPLAIAYEEATKEIEIGISDTVPCPANIYNLVQNTLSPLITELSSHSPSINVVLPNNGVTVRLSQNATTS